MLLPVWLAIPAGGKDVLVLYSDTPTNIDDVEAKLEATGRFANVDVVSAGALTPTANDLAPYDAVLVYSNSSFDDANRLGDRLADYVDQGGNVVEAMYAQLQPALGLGGRFVDENYEPLAASSDFVGENLHLVAVDPAHPVLANVDDVDSGALASLARDAVVSPTGALVAEWTNGEPLVAVDVSRPGWIVGVNLFPPSSDAQAYLWDASTDGATLFANALDWVSPPDSDGDSLKDVLDNCDYTAGLDQADTDADEIGDLCDRCDGGVDTDADGICDDVDACPGANDWQDTDGDTVADACDACPLDAPDDADLDGECDTPDPCVGFPNEDADSDGVCDVQDLCPGGDDALDTDGDAHADGCDCSPLDVLAYDGASEVCDEHDNDCDGTVDEAGAGGEFTFYIDLDGDGFGADDGSIDRCVMPVNYVLVAGDCDDDRISVHPDADEACDGVDNDCDGTVDDPACSEVAATGCGCSSAPSASWLSALLLLALARRRG